MVSRKVPADTLIRPPHAQLFQEFSMKKIAILSVLAFTAAVTHAGSAEPVPDPEAVVRAYTAAANDGDLDRFLGLYHPDIQKFRFPGELTSQGLAHNRQAYAKSFAANPDLHVEIVSLVSLGDKVMVHDRVTGLANGSTAEELTVYEVRNGLITRIAYVERIAT